jgi:hypothetical protein
MKSGVVDGGLVCPGDGQVRRSSEANQRAEVCLECTRGESEDAVRLCGRVVGWHDRDDGSIRSALFGRSRIRAQAAGSDMKLCLLVKLM